MKLLLKEINQKKKKKRSIPLQYSKR